jgi:1-aminocyclopropane-1-carboxylate deaminase/D-cysteine desulfhydrase-like pyridoxal-dependent ACC family enzyme
MTVFIVSTVVLTEQRQAEQRLKEQKGSNRFAEGEWLRTHVSELASSASEKLGKRIEFTPGEVLANAGYCKAGYGVLTEPERKAIQLFAKYEGLLLDPVYTGRAAAGMIDLIRKGFFKKDETVLFLHTGGQPALFADQYANKI